MQNKIPIRSIARAYKYVYVLYNMCIYLCEYSASIHKDGAFFNTRMIFAIWMQSFQSNLTSVSKNLANYSRNNVEE